MTSIEELFRGYRERVDGVLLELLPTPSSSSTQLLAAMQYAATVGGKRIRPILTYATGQALGVPLERLDVPAAAVEMLHAYSLVHDDLPAMDDDDLRRGQPTCHKKFNEATAILAGDALQALAFTVLATNENQAIDAAHKLRMVAVLGDASGSAGMAVGQAIDLESVNEALTLEELENMHRHKTGALIRASVALGALAAENPTQDIADRLDRFADAIGLCFQIVDDILDVVADTDTLGKQQGADIALNKPTYPALLGLEGAREHAAQTHARALAELDGLGPEFDELRQLANYITKRRH